MVVEGIVRWLFRATRTPDVVEIQVIVVAMQVRPVEIQVIVVELHLSSVEIHVKIVEKQVSAY